VKPIASRFGLPSAGMKKIATLEMLGE